MLLHQYIMLYSQMKNQQSQPASTTQFTMKAIIVLSIICSSWALPLGLYGNGDLESLNVEIMEKLRQIEGSERGLYHVYLPDGRLQRVQYTTAPISQQSQIQQTQAHGGHVADNLNARSLPAVNTYYVQTLPGQLNEQRSLRGAAQYNARFSQEAEASAQNTQPLEVDAQFVPIQVVTTEQFAQLRSQL